KALKHRAHDAGEYDEGQQAAGVEKRHARLDGGIVAVDVERAEGKRDDDHHHQHAQAMGGSDQVGAGMVAFGERSHFTGTANGAGEPGRLEVGTAQGTKNVRSQPAKPDGEHGAGQDVGKVDTDEPDHVRG